MPSSDHATISQIVEIIRKVNPKSVLDIGIGCGKYGMLIREYLDGHWTGGAFHKKDTWKTVLVGMEVFGEYITPVHEYLYSEILVVDAYQYLKECNHLGAFDLVLMGDVIEHFPKDQGKELIGIIRDKWLSRKGHLIVSTPNFQTQINNESLAVFGNSNEVHRSRWTMDDFYNLGMDFQIDDGRHLIADLVKK